MSHTDLGVLQVTAANLGFGGRRGALPRPAFCCPLCHLQSLLRSTDSTLGNWSDASGPASKPMTNATWAGLTLHLAFSKCEGLGSLTDSLKPLHCVRFREWGGLGLFHISFIPVKPWHFLSHRWDWISPGRQLEPAQQQFSRSVRAG